MVRIHGSRAAFDGWPTITPSACILQPWPRRSRTSRKTAGGPGDSGCTICATRPPVDARPTVTPQPASTGPTASSLQSPRAAGCRRFPSGPAGRPCPAGPGRPARVHSKTPGGRGPARRPGHRPAVRRPRPAAPSPPASGVVNAAVAALTNGQALPPVITHRLPSGASTRRQARIQRSHQARYCPSGSWSACGRRRSRCRCRTAGRRRPAGPSRP